MSAGTAVASPRRWRGSTHRSRSRASRPTASTRSGSSTSSRSCCHRRPASTTIDSNRRPRRLPRRGRSGRQDRAPRLTDSKPEEIGRRGDISRVPRWSIAVMSSGTRPIERGAMNDVLPDDWWADMRTKVRRALVATYGVEVGTEAASDATVWAWEHRQELSRMKNPTGYVFRVGQSASRRYRRRSSNSWTSTGPSFPSPAIRSPTKTRFPDGTVPTLRRARSAVGIAARREAVRVHRTRAAEHPTTTASSPTTTGSSSSTPRAAESVATVAVHFPELGNQERHLR